MRFLPLLVLLLAPLSVFGAETPAPAPAAPELNNVAPAQLTEHIMGDPAAKTTLTEYASLTCPHCAHFAKEILPKLTDKYIATGKVKLIYRDYPLDGLSLHAALIGQCMPEERYFVFIKTLFGNQAAWMSSADPEATLQQYAKLAGLSADRISACLNDKALQSAVVKRRAEAEQKYKVEATPSFVVDDGKELIAGATSFEEFDKVLSKYVK